VIVEAIAKHPRLNGAEPCHNRHPSRDKSQSQVGFAMASHVMWILDRPTYLCGQCVREWQEVWEQALDGSPQERVTRARRTVDRLGRGCVMEVAS
jgi:hypothetical protein